MLNIIKKDITSNLVVNINNISISNIKSIAPFPFVFIDSMQYRNLEIKIENSRFIDNNLGLGTFFQFNQNSKNFTIENCIFSNNTGYLGELKPFEELDLTNPQIISIIDSNFSQNYGNERGLFFVTSNAKLNVKNSRFIENFSTGRGSIVSGEKANS